MKNIFQRLGDRGDRRIDLQMTPMVDVVFLLLIFFLWTTSLQRPERDLPAAAAMTLHPGEATGSAATGDPLDVPLDEIMVKLVAEPGLDALQIHFNQQVLSDRRELTDRLREIVSLGLQPPVIVDPAASVSMEEAVAVFDAIRSLGIEQVSFAVRE